MTVHVKIEGEVAEQLDRLVAEGHYASRDQVIAEALSLIVERDERLAIAEGLTDVEAGRITPIERVREEVREWFAPSDR